MRVLLCILALSLLLGAKKSKKNTDSLPNVINEDVPCEVTDDPLFIDISSNVDSNFIKSGEPSIIIIGCLLLFFIVYYY